MNLKSNINRVVYLNIEKKILTSLRNITPLPNFPASRGPPRLKRAAIANWNARISSTHDGSDGSYLLIIGSIFQLIRINRRHDVSVRARASKGGRKREGKKEKRGDRRGACARGVATTADAFLEWNRRSQFASRRPPSLPLFTDFLIVLEEVTFHGDKSFDPRPRPTPPKPSGKILSNISRRFFNSLDVSTAFQIIRDPRASSSRSRNVLITKKWLK